MKFDSTLSGLRLALAIVCGIAAATMNDARAEHPMDPLSGDEIVAAVKAIEDSGRLEGRLSYPMIRLYEMPKQEVLGWSAGEPLSRKAEVTIKRGPQLYRATIDLGSKSIEDWKDLSGSQVALQLSEYLRMNSLVARDEDWQAAMKKRGLTDLGKIVNLPVTVGRFSNDTPPRTFKVLSYASEGVRNYWGRPIEGVIVTVDLDANKVISVQDLGVTPIPDGPVDFHKEAIDSLREGPARIAYSPANNPNLRIDGHVFSWQKWRFHLRLDPQVGLVFSDVTYEDDGRRRSILYEASLSELFVPYMDPGEAWFFRTYMDAGEYAVGLSTSPIVPGADAPESAILLDIPVGGVNGKPQTLAKAVAVFEQYSGGPAWRHMDPISRKTESRRNQSLVVRHITTLGNYDYLFDWIFHLNGTITVRVGATGIVASKAVRHPDALVDVDGPDDVYGRYVAPHTVAVNHDHYLAFRLDFDVDGVANSFVQDKLEMVEFDDSTPRKGGWLLRSRTAKREADAKLRMNIMKPSVWRIANASNPGPLGYPTSYQIAPGAGAFVSLLDDDDWPQKRAAFSKYNLHVTPYRAEERFAAGEFANQGDGSDGLGAWTSANRAIERTDIVAWYTVGFHHVVRAEDWPVMPTAWHEFSLRPFDFFERNPAIDLAE